jgi:uracil-DNA glycosylase
MLVLGVYPSALHVRWRRPDAVTIGALAVDDEPTVFWDGADAHQRINHWCAAVNWRADWGTVSPAGGNGSSGRIVVNEILTPLGTTADRTYFTDCLPYYFLKSGTRSQGHRISTIYQPFAAAHQLSQAELPHRPRPQDLVARTLAEEAPTLRDQLHESGARRVVTLGQEAADAFAAIFATEPVRLRPDHTYGNHRSVTIANRRIDWLPLTHPGNRTPAWRIRHQQWTATASL